MTNWFSLNQLAGNNNSRNMSLTVSLHYTVQIRVMHLFIYSVLSDKYTYMFADNSTACLLRTYFTIFITLPNRFAASRLKT